MQKIFFILVGALILAACSSSAPVTSEAIKPAMAEASTPSKAKGGAAIKTMKCKYDTDCMVQNSCLGEKCKLTGNACRFRSDCPSPRGTCVSNICEFH